MLIERIESFDQLHSPMKFLSFLFYILISGAIAGFLLISSVQFSDGNATASVEIKEKNWYEMNVITQNGGDILDQKVISLS